MTELPVEIHVDEVKALLDSGTGAFRLIDCREPDEWNICRIAGAELMPLTRFVEEADARLTDKDQRLIIYCHHGIRSLRAASWLRQRGHHAAQSLAGGIDAWAAMVEPDMARY